MSHVNCALALATVACAAHAQPLQRSACTPFWVGHPSPTFIPAHQLMKVHDDGTGPAIYAVAQASGTVWRFNGASWAMLPPPPGALPFAVNGPVLLRDGGAERLCVLVCTGATGGEIHDPNGPNQECRLYKWTGSAWTQFLNHPLFGTVVAQLSLPWQGDHLLLGYRITANGRLTALCRWTGTNWSDLGTTQCTHMQLYLFDDGSGPALLAFGDFSQINGVPALGFAKWDGQAWSAPWPERVLSGGQVGGVFDDGSGPALYGAFAAYVNGVLTNGWGRWDGQSFTGVGGVVNSPGHVGGAADMVIFDDGSGPAMFIGGGFSQVTGGVAANGIARYRNGVWSPCGPGISGSVQRLFVMNHARGPSLFAFGGLITAGGGTAPKLAQYVGCPNCYPDCDLSPSLTANDFMCFLTKFAQNDPYANCDVSTQAPAINAADFACFLTRFAAGCP